MKAPVVMELDDFRPIWRVVKGRCAKCWKGKWPAISTQHWECPLDASECHKCGAMAWKVTHFYNGCGWLRRG